MLAGFSQDKLQRAYDAGLPSQSMYGQVQHERRLNCFNDAACEALIHMSGATNFDVSVPVPYSIFSRLPHVAPEFSPAILQGAPIAYPLSFSTADTRETSRARQSKEDRNDAASAQVNDAASYANVRSDVMQAAFEAGCRTKLVRLQNTRTALQQHNPDLDVSELTREGLFPNMSPADFEALDEAAFQAKIDQWKSDNGLATGTSKPWALMSADEKRNKSAQSVEKERAAREAFGGTVKFTLATGCTTEISKAQKAVELRQHLSGYGYTTGNKSAKKYRKGNTFGEPCKTCVAFVGKLYNGTACVPCDQFYVPRAIDIIKAGLDAQNDHDIDFGVKMDLNEFKTMSKKRKKSASKPQGAKKAKTAAPAE